MRVVLARDLKRGDILVCPKDGAHEQITGARPNGGTTFVRTRRHDHLFAPATRLDVAS